MYTREELEKYVYELNAASEFQCGSVPWSDPVYGFAYNGSLPSKFMEESVKHGILLESMNRVICILGDWEKIPEGIILTDQRIYVNSAENKDKNFKVRYDEITGLSYNPDTPELRIETGGRCFTVDTPLWNKRNLFYFLQMASEGEKAGSAVYPDLYSGKGVVAGNGINAAGLTYGSVSNSSSRYFDDKIVGAKGHGFAAEHANHLADLLLGKDARIVGDNNMKNGADRVVDGIQIQSKYCASGSRCIQECFENGEFRYWNPDGSPMQIEVPSDMYDSAVQAMENRIRRGEVSGVSDPAEAKNIIRKGHFTYAQVKNIAKAGTVESICFDAVSGAVIATGAFGITAMLAFATNLWGGEDLETALKSATVQGLKVGGTTFISAVLAGQISKAGLNSALVGGSEAVVKLIGPKASAMLVNAFRSGTNIYGAAAMKSAAKLLRSNVITGVVTFAVLSVGDVANVFSGRISGGQLFKNLAGTVSTVAGGGVGWVAGASAGAALGSFIPGIGNAAGAIIGGLAGAFGGGSLASAATGAVLDGFIEDDAEWMVSIIQDVFTGLAEDYLISQEEAEEIVDRLKEKLDGGLLKDMYASSNRKAFARDLMEEYFEDVAYSRKRIALPTQEEMQKSLRIVLEEMADDEACYAY